MANPDPNVNGCTYADLEEIANFLKKKLSFVPTAAVICGCGFEHLADSIENPITVDFGQIPKFPLNPSGINKGRVIAGKISACPVIFLTARLHYFDGYPLWQCCIPICALKVLGCRYIVLTNSVGAINPEFNEGDLMIIKDHVNFLSLGGNSPLRGPNMEELGPRFRSMSSAYDKCLRNTALEIAEKMSINIREGIYGCAGGPAFETVAECKLMQICGIDTIGFSTAYEVETAKQCGLIVVGLCIIIRKCKLDYDCDDCDEEEIDHEKVHEIMESTQVPVKEFLKRLLEQIGIISCVCKVPQ